MAQSIVSNKKSGLTVAGACMVMVACMDPSIFHPVHQYVHVLLHHMGGYVRMHACMLRARTPGPRPVDIICMHACMCKRSREDRTRGAVEADVSDAKAWIVQGGRCCMLSRIGSTTS